VDAAALLLAALSRAGAPRVAVAARRAGVVVAAGVLAGVLLLASLGCALAALWIKAVPRLGPAGAALVVAVCLLVLGLAALSVVLRRPLRARAPAQAPTPIPLDALMRDNKTALLTAAVVAGLCVGLNGKQR
jgi:hypothetical protein